MNLKQSFFSLILLVALLVSACDRDSVNELRRTDSYRLVLEVDSDDPAVVKHVSKVLYDRFLYELPSARTRVAVDIRDNNQLHYIFKNGAPAETQLKGLSTIAGVINAYAEGKEDESWFTNKDIGSATADVIGVTPNLFLGFTKAAGEKIDKLSKQFRGQLVHLTMDEKVLMSARIMEPFGESVAISMDTIEEAKLYAAVLAGGELETGVRVVSFEQLTK